jgi:hypothetical protein
VKSITLHIQVIMPASQKVQPAIGPWRPATGLSPSCQGHGVAVKPKKKEAESEWGRSEQRWKENSVWR